MIAEAKGTLQLANYSFTGMRENRYLLVSALADARKRGVQVEMLLRDGHASVFTSLATFNQGRTYWSVAGSQFAGPAANNANYLNIMASIRQ